MGGFLSSLLLLLRPRKKNPTAAKRRCAHCGHTFSVGRHSQSGRCPSCGRTWTRKDEGGRNT